MLTVAKAKRINGCDYREIKCGLWAALDDGKVRASYKGRDIKRALFVLVEEVLRQNRMKALSRDGYKCVRCGSMTGLSSHHIKHRGMGGANRDDRVENLESLCRECHEREHGG